MSILTVCLVFSVNNTNIGKVLHNFACSIKVCLAFSLCCAGLPDDIVPLYLTWLDLTSHLGSAVMFVVRAPAAHNRSKIILQHCDGILFLAVFYLLSQSWQSWMMKVETLLDTAWYCPGSWWRWQLSPRETITRERWEERSVSLVFRHNIYHIRRRRTRDVEYSELLRLQEQSQWEAGQQEKWNQPELRVHPWLHQHQQQIIILLIWLQHSTGLWRLQNWEVIL